MAAQTAPRVARLDDAHHAVAVGGHEPPGTRPLLEGPRILVRQRGDRVCVAAPLLAHG